MCAWHFLEMLLETATANGEEVANQVLLFLSLYVKQMPLCTPPLWVVCG